MEKYDEDKINNAIKQFDLIEENLTEKREFQSHLKEYTNQFNELNRKIKSNQKEIENTSDTCPTCNQEWPDVEKHKEHKKKLQDEIDQWETELKEIGATIEQINIAISECDLVINDKPEGFKNRDEALTAKNSFSSSEDDLKSRKIQLKPLKSELAEKIESKNDLVEPVKPERIDEIKSELEYDDISSVNSDANKLSKLETELKFEMKKENPYEKQYESLKEEAEEELDNSHIIKYEEEIQNHKDMEKYLTRKDSPIRRSVTNVRLPQLNKLTSEYLEKLDLRYQVQFNDDLTATIYSFDKEMGVSGISSGEEERIGMALSWAFRSLFEKMHYDINFYGIDERIDAGLDGAGVERAVSFLYEMANLEKKNIFLISHKKEILDYASRVMLVKRKGHFSEVTYE